MMMINAIIVVIHNINIDNHSKKVTIAPTLVSLATFAATALAGPAICHWAKDCTPENTSETIVDFQWHFPTDVLAFSN